MRGDGLINKNVFDLELVAKDVWCRIDMVFIIDIEADCMVISLVKLSGRSIIPGVPVCEATDNVVGIINMKDLLLVEDKASFCVSDYAPSARLWMQSCRADDGD